MQKLSSFSSIILITLSINILATPILLKKDNQKFIVLAYNPVFYACIKQIDSKNYYIQDKVTSGKVNLLYILTLEIIADVMTKVLIQAKFYLFVKQMYMS